MTVAGKNSAKPMVLIILDGWGYREDPKYNAMAELAAKRGTKKLYVHAFLDGRDTPPRSAAASLAAMEKRFKALGVGQIASICGRYYAMDRDKRWDRVKEAFDLLTIGRAAYVAPNALAA